MQETIKNRTIFCRDNLEILQGINSKTIDLIYLDPPFNKKKIFTAPIGSSAEGARFKDIFTQEDIKEEWVQTIKEDYHSIHRLLEAVKDIEGKTSYNFCYLAYMAIRLIECYRVLKNTGSMYLHCDPTMSHYLKILLDCVCGEQNFRNEIVWCYRGAGYPKKDFGNRHDIIYRYSKSNVYTFNVDDVREEYAEATKQRFKHYIGNKRNGQDFGEQSLNPKGKHPDDWWQIQPIAPSAKERVGYPTQKPLALLERILRASSNPQDIILDPFCGCATTCVAAEKLNRQWIGIDISYKAFELVQTRIKDEVYEEGLIKGENGALPTIHFFTDPPQRTDIKTDDRDKKNVYVISHKKYKGEYKIGIARNVKSRLNSYQTGDPDRSYTLEFSILTPHYRQVETYIHRKYNNKHEWVTGKLEDIIEDIKNYNTNKDHLL